MGIFCLLFLKLLEIMTQYSQQFFKLIKKGVSFRIKIIITIFWAEIVKKLI